MQTNGTTNPADGCGNQRHCNPAAGPELLQPSNEKTLYDMARTTSLEEHHGRVPVLDMHELGCYCGRSNRPKVIATGNVVVDAVDGLPLNALPLKGVPLKACLCKCV